MTVVYPQELTPLAQALSGMGFTMQPMGGEVAADAVLFTSAPHLALRERPGAQGALMLNVRGMSAAQTAQALRRRSQAPLF